MDEKTLRRAFKFFDKDNSGTIDYSELKMAMCSLGTVPNDTEVQHIMKLIDVDSSHALDFPEFQKFMEKYMSASVPEGQTMSDKVRADLIRAFKTLDRDADGFLSWNEIKGMIATNQKQGTKKLTTNEVSHFVSEILQGADLDGDGRISQDEFLIYMCPKNVFESNTNDPDKKKSNIPRSMVQDFGLPGPGTILSSEVKRMAYQSGTIRFTMTDDEGKNSLHQICEQNKGIEKDHFSAYALAGAGAFDEQDLFGRTPLHYLVDKNPEVTTQLLEAYGEISGDAFLLQDEEGNTAMHILAKKKRNIKPEFLNVYARAANKAKTPEKDCVKDDPRYKRFFTKVKVGANPEKVKENMVKAGLDPSMLDKPDEPAPDSIYALYGGDGCQIAFRARNMLQQTALHILAHENLMFGQEHLEAYLSWEKDAMENLNEVTVNKIQNMLK